MLLSFLDDASCFVLRNRYLVDLAPLQLYTSALIFAPKLSIIERVFEHVRRHNSEEWLDRLPEVPLGWSPEKQRLEAHGEQFDCVVFAPDGSMLATASWDKTVRLWDVKTGEQIRKLEGHDEWVNYVAFSPDGQLVASASDDGTVRLW
jgi:WD40 repeat protein